MQIVYILAVSIPIFWMSQFSVMQKVLFVFSISAWIFLYYLRAITEERHLLKDDEYKAYIEKVKYRFIPKLF
jgi:protein-S-isoprenylcysteine O-methyltransferase Ste14